jgi:hypothetical protein
MRSSAWFAAGSLTPDHFERLAARKPIGPAHFSGWAWGEAVAVAVNRNAARSVFPPGSTRRQRNAAFACGVLGNTSGTTGGWMG